MQHSVALRSANVPSRAPAGPGLRPSHRRQLVVPKAALQTQRVPIEVVKSQNTALSMLGTASLLAVNLATFFPKASLLPQLFVHSLGVGFLVKSFEELRAAKQQKQEASKDVVHAPTTAALVVAQAPSAATSDAAESKAMQMQLEAALCEAQRIAQQQAIEAANATCINRALRHTNANLTQQLRDERVLRLQQRIRLERFYRDAATSTAATAEGGVQARPSLLMSVTCDPAVDRAVLRMVQSEEMRAMERQLVTLRDELMTARGQLERHKARADACEAAALRMEQQ